MTNHQDAGGAREADREPGTREDGEAMPPAAIDPGADDRPGLPAGDGGGAGEEGAPPSQNRPGGERLTPDQETMIKDATGF
jgi:hypothetical protein